jgi:hypothetical protein
MNDANANAARDRKQFVVGQLDRRKIVLSHLEIPPLVTVKLAVAASLLREALETQIPGSSATRPYLSGRLVRKGKSMTSVDTRCFILFGRAFYAFGSKSPDQPEANDGGARHAW